MKKNGIVILTVDAVIFMLCVGIVYAVHQAVQVDDEALLGVLEMSCLACGGVTVCIIYDIFS